eukprot:GHVN01105766.1.p1 GENE.GHVN01105766.1~~GHVN01105766.1.p1  ORF type:complete len:627 (+),score=112.12 GHVN01105766.1:218-2098(+)
MGDDTLPVPQFNVATQPADPPAPPSQPSQPSQLSQPNSPASSSTTSCSCLHCCRRRQEQKGVSVSSDYKVPRWLKRQGVVFQYEYSSTVIAKYGVVNYLLQGSKDDPLVICVHGLNGTRLTFQDVADVLCKYGFRVLTFDLYGHGLSAAPPYRECSNSYNLKFFVQQIEELLERLGLSEERLSVIGFSMGCVIANGFVSAHRDRIDRLCLISPAGLLPNKPCPVKCLAVCPCCINIIPCCITRACCCLHKKQFLKGFRQDEIDSGIAEALWQRYTWQLFVKKGVMSALMGCVHRLPLWSSKKLFTEVGNTGISVLIMWGKQDQVIPVECAQRLRDCFPNGHLIVFPDATHLLLADQPAQAIATILTFFEFPPNAKMSEWHWLLPFSDNGRYVPRRDRAPAGIKPEDHSKSLNYEPKLTVTGDYRTAASSARPPHHPPSTLPPIRVVRHRYDSLGRRLDEPLTPSPASRHQGVTPTYSQFSMVDVQRQRQSGQTVSGGADSSTPQVSEDGERIESIGAIEELSGCGVSDSTAKEVKGDRNGKGGLGSIDENASFIGLDEDGLVTVGHEINTPRRYSSAVGINRSTSDMVRYTTGLLAHPHHSTSGIILSMDMDADVVAVGGSDSHAS